MEDIRVATVARPQVFILTRASVDVNFNDAKWPRILWRILSKKSPLEQEGPQLLEATK